MHVDSTPSALASRYPHCRHSLVPSWRSLRGVSRRSMRMRARLIAIGGRQRRGPTQPAWHHAAEGCASLLVPAVSSRPVVPWSRATIRYKSRRDDGGHSTPPARRDPSSSSPLRNWDPWTVGTGPVPVTLELFPRTHTRRPPPQVNRTLFR